jgi:hypothetical protein
MDFVHSVRKHFSPTNTVILSYDYAFNGPRHFMYYLPEYKVYSMDERVDIQGKKRKVFWWQNGETFLSDAVYIPKGIKYFVSPMDDKSVLADMKKAGEKICILSHDKENIAFYGDISLASKAYAGMKFVIEE